MAAMLNSSTLMPQQRRTGAFNPKGTRRQPQTAAEQPGI